MPDNQNKSKKTLDALKDLTTIFVIMITKDKKVTISNNNNSYFKKDFCFKAKSFISIKF